MFKLSETGGAIERLKRTGDKGHKLMKKLRIFMEMKKRGVDLIICRKLFAFFRETYFEQKKVSVSSRRKL